MSNHSSTSTTTMPPSTPPASPRFVYHTSPAPPPTKKSRSTSSPIPSQEQRQQQQEAPRHSNGESSSSRRAELQKLMRGSSSNSTDGLLNLARSQLSPTNGNGHLTTPPISRAPPIRSNTPPSSTNSRPPRSRSPPPMNRHTPPPLSTSQPPPISPSTSQPPPSHRHTPPQNKPPPAIPAPPRSAPPALLNYLHADDTSVISTQSQTSRRSSDDTSPRPPVAPTALLRLTHKLRDVQEEKTKALQRLALLESQQANKNEGNREERRSSLVMLVWIAERQARRGLLRRAFRVLSRHVAKVQPHSPPQRLTRTLSASAITPLRPSPISTPSSSLPVTPSLSLPSSRPRPSPTPSAPPLSSEHLAHAARCTPTAYRSTLATYHVRPPFVPPNENNLWNGRDSRDYIASADPMTAESVEIMVEMAEGEGGVWILRKNEDFVNGEGGRVGMTYIDGMGVEREYPLGEIYEEAQMTRNSYCSSLMAAAAALQAANTVISSERDAPTMSTTKGGNDAPVVPSPETMTPLPKTTMPQEAVPPVVPSPETTPPTIDKPSNKGPAPDDVFFSLLGQLLTLTFRILFTLFWTIPFRLVVFALYVGIMFCFVGGVWMLLADDRGAMMMGAKAVTDTYADVY